MTGVSAIKAASGRHPHVAYQDGSEPPLLRLMTQPLDKHNQIRVAEITTLIGAHHLIIIGLYRQRVGANDASVGKATDRLGGAGDRMGYFLPRRRRQAGATDKPCQQRNRGFFISYQRGISVFTSAFCARWRSR